VDVPEPEQRDILERLGFEVEPGQTWQVRPPSWRRDVDGEADIVEEIVRIHGIEHVPSTPLARAPGVATPTATPEQLVERRVRRTAASRGLAEAVTWSFVSEAEAAPFGGGTWVLANPISEELKVMRPSLLPGLIAAAKRNLARGADGIRLFELGRRYLAESERPTVGLLLAGTRAPRDWRTGKAQLFEAYDAKAEALALLAAAGARTDNLQALPARPASTTPAARPGSASAPRTCSPSSASCTPRRSRRSTSPVRSSRPRSSSTRFRPGEAARAICGRPMRRRHCRP
jgi:phenylalanyl-tRNA synthetase beta chain